MFMVELLKTRTAKKINVSVCKSYARFAQLETIMKYFLGIAEQLWTSILFKTEVVPRRVFSGAVSFFRWRL